MSQEEAFNKITAYTGGRAAEELIFNTRTSGRLMIMGNYQDC